MLSMRMAVAVVTAGFIGAACCPQGTCDDLQQQVNALEERVAAFELWVSGGRTPEAVPVPDINDGTWTNLHDWLAQVRYSLCTLEVTENSPPDSRLCPSGPGDPDGSPPPPPPFLY